MNKAGITQKSKPQLLVVLWTLFELYGRKQVRLDSALGVVGVICNCTNNSLNSLQENDPEGPIVRETLKCDEESHWRGRERLINLLITKASKQTALLTWNKLMSPSI